MAAISLAFIVGVIGLLAFFIMKMNSAAAEEEVEERKREKEKKRTRGAVDRMQRGARARGAGAGDSDEDDDASEEDGADGGRSKTNALKDQKKQERKAQQAAERQARADRENAKSEKQSKYSAKQQEKEKEYAKLDAKRDEEERKAKEQKERREREEMEKWKDMFAVDAEGEDDGAMNDPGALERFVDFVKIRKVVQLEDLAAQFRMKTQSAIDRLHDLEKFGRISGIFDDRGKYVYITVEEMQELAAWLQRKGRVNRGELVAACNRIVRLNPTEEDKAKLEAEAKSVAAELEEDSKEHVAQGASPA